jgi:hypothetical protein
MARENQRRWRLEDYRDYLPVQRYACHNLQSIKGLRR